MAKTRMIGAGDPNPVIYLSISGSLTKTQTVGGAVDLTGLVFTAHKYNGTTEVVTTKVVKSRNRWGTVAGTQTVEVGYSNKKIVVSASVVAVALDSIAVTTSPTETEFAQGADIDLTGMVVTATYTDESTKEVTDYTFTPEVMASDTTEVTISYTEGGVTKTTTQAVELKTN